MADTPPKPETDLTEDAAVETEQAVPPVIRFNIDEALNKPGFAEFISKYKNSENLNMDDAEDIAKKFQTFEAQKAVGTELKKLYSSQIETEMGIKLDSTDLKSIDDHIEKMAIENPDALLELQEKLDTYRDLPEEIEALQVKLNGLGRAYSHEVSKLALERDVANIDTAKNHLGLIGKIKLAYLTLTGDGSEAKKIRIARDAIKHKYPGRKKDEILAIYENIQSVGIPNIETKLKDINSTTKELTDAQKQIVELRQEILGGIGGIKELKETIQQKVKAELEQLMTGDIDDIDSAQDRFDELTDARDTTETNVNPLANARADREIQGEIDTKIKQKVTEKIQEALINTDLGNNPLAQLGKALESITQRTSLGSLNNKDTKRFISDTLKSTAQALVPANDPANKVKKLIVNRILIKLA